MFKLLLPFLTLAFFPFLTLAQCSTTNATSCQCSDGVTTNCDLLPDLKVGRAPLLVSGSQGVIEYSQTGNGANDGRLRVSVTTPNIGVGPLEVRTTTTFVCGTDTFYGASPGICADGSDPKQLIIQRVYHKTGNIMSSYDRPAGSMTYHPSHGHMHVDDWGIYTLRTEDPNEPNPLNWPVIGTGSKLAFCLMDYGSCSTYNGHCKDNNDNTLLNGDFPNYGLGGGSYNCSSVVQGISSGYTDIYYQSLDGMWIDIPPGTCNGNYWIVVQIDPYNYFLESDETNNVIAVPYTLTKQVAAGASVSANKSSTICQTDSITLTASSGISYLWSNGETTQSITVNQSGNYAVSVGSTACGTSVSSPFSVTTYGPPLPLTTGAEVCGFGTAQLSASGGSTLKWYDNLSFGNLIHTGASYTPIAGSLDQTFYVESETFTPGINAFVGPVNNSIGVGAYYNGANSQIFDVLQKCILESVKVYRQTAGTSTFQVKNSAGVVILTSTQALPAGESRVTLNFNLDPGTGYQITRSGAEYFYRNNGGVSYPYTLNNYLTINSSTAGSAFYYFFYDWHVVKADEYCRSNRAAVTLKVNQLPAVSFTGLGSVYDVTSPPVVLTGNPAGGVFSGPGINANTFDPALAGVGGPYTILYTYTDGNSCTNNTQLDVNVSAALNCNIPNGLYENNISFESADLHWSTSSTAEKFQMRYAKLGSGLYEYKTIKDNSYSIALNGLVPATGYFWQVKAICSNTSQGFSISDTFYTAAAPTSCIVPNQTTTSNISEYGATVNWNPAITADRFMVRYQDVNSGSYYFKSQTGVSSLYLSGLSPATNYMWQVKSICGTNSMGFCAPVYFSTPAQNFHCAIPFDLQSVNISQTAATLEWNPIVTADKFQMRYSLANNNNFSYKSSSSYTNSFNVTGLQPGSAYKWQVKTICGNSTTGFTPFSYFSTSGVRISDPELETQNEFFVIYPNPAIDIITLEFNQDTEINSYSIEIRDITGRLLLNKTITESLTEIDIKEFPSGIYSMLVWMDKTVHLQNFIIK